MALVNGLGINDADYVVQLKKTVGYVDGKQKQKRIWTCPFYQVWVSMLNRCYNEKCRAKQPTYEGCMVCEDWCLFSIFKTWMQKQDWEGKYLDKDILVSGNKVYSPDNCVFVTRQVNNFLTDSGASRGEWLIGAYWNKKASKFIAQCCNPFTNKREGIGYYTSELEAHQAWLKRKLEHAHTLAALQTDERVAKALIDRYENYTN